MNVILKSATIVAPGNTLHNKKRDIHIKNGKIEAIGAKLENDSNAREIQYKNLHVSLGWFDSGVAFGEPGFEERETMAHGLEVAAKSGYTDILLNPNTHPSPDSSSDIVFITERASKRSTSLYPIGNLTAKGEGNGLAELYDMHQAGAVAFYDFKSPLSNPNLMKIALQYAQNFGGLIFSYPMEKEIKGKGVVNEGEVSTRLGLKGIPALAEELQVARDLYILEYTGGRLHIPTISTDGAVKLISEAKKKGLDVSCSIPIHNLVLSDEVLESFDSNYKVIPPLRAKEELKSLRKAVLNGTIDFVTADHTPLDIEEKRLEFDKAEYGSIGLESAFGTLNKIFGLEKAIELLTKGRERFGIDTPSFDKGAPANFTLFDSQGEYEFNKEHILSTSKNSAFLGQTLKGSVIGIINNGKVNLAQ